MRAALALAVLAVPALPRAGTESSIGCSGGIVAVGDTKLDLLGKCGVPTLREAQEESRGQLVLFGQGAAVAGGRRVSATIERWSYDFGPRRFTQVFMLEGGRVTAIDRGGYGYAKDAAPVVPAIPSATCESSALREGETTLDLLAKCGEPAARDRHLVERAVAVREAGNTVLVTRAVEVEVWSYNFGPNRFLHLVTLEDGKVIGVDRGGYGYRSSVDPGSPGATAADAAERARW